MRPSLSVKLRVRPLLLAIASVLLPGLGHAAVGRRRAAALFLVPTLLIGGTVAAWALTSGTYGVAATLVTPGALTLLFAANILVAGWRTSAVVDAVGNADPGRLGRRARGPRHRHRGRDPAPDRRRHDHRGRDVPRRHLRRHRPGRPGGPGRRRDPHARPDRAAGGHGAALGREPRTVGLARPDPQPHPGHPAVPDRRRQRDPAELRRLGAVAATRRDPVGRRRPVRPAAHRLRRRGRPLEPPERRDAARRGRRQDGRDRDDRPPAQPPERPVPAGGRP